MLIAVKSITDGKQAVSVLIILTSVRLVFEDRFTELKAGIALLDLIRKISGFLRSRLIELQAATYINEEEKLSYISQ